MFKAGDIVKVDLNPSKGGEKAKIRPCLILVGSGHPWGLVIVVPVTEMKKRLNQKLFLSIPSHAKTGLVKNSAIDCFQIRCISENRIKGKIGIVSYSILNDVRAKLAMILDIGDEDV